MNRRVLWVSALLLPTLAVGLVGYFWFAGPATPTFAAKLWVFSSDDGVVSVRAFVGAIAHGRPPPPIEVALVVTDSDGNTHRLSTTTSSDGVADFSLHLNTTAPTLTLERSQAHESLVSGSHELLEATAWITPSHAPALRPKPPLADLLVEVGSGVLAVPFVSQVRVQHGAQGCFVRLTGAHVSDPESCCNSGCSVYPSEHIVEAELGHASADKPATVLLPVVPGAMPVHVDRGQVYVLSATPRTVAHVAWITEHEVLGFSSVNLAPEPLPVLPGPAMVRAGTPVYWGVVRNPPNLARFAGSRVWVVTSSEPDFVSGATVAWPLDTAVGASVVHFRPLPIPAELDGFAQHHIRSREMIGTNRRYLAQALGGLLVVEVLLLWGYVKQAPTDFMSEIPAQKSRLWWVVIACLMLGFGGMMALFWWK